MIDNQGNKGGILLVLQDKLSIFKIPKLIIMTVRDIRQIASADLSELLVNRIGSRIIAIRSCAANEDGRIHSQAGAYESFLNIESHDPEAVHSATSAVIESYKKAGLVEDENEVIFQEQILAPSISGVLFTHDLDTGAPYFVVNYDDISGSTSTVTSGTGDYSNRTLYVHRDAISKVRSLRFKKLFAAVQELERELGSAFLDIEFALDSDYQPYLFQVRPITTATNWNRSLSLKIDSELYGIERFLKERLKPEPGLFGRTTIFGQMPDWNPAEIIGRVPGNLAFSLYRELITNEVWREARKIMGYFSPDGHRLLVSLAGQPFVDLRRSFNSFLPADLSNEISEKLVNAWIERIILRPELHDKIEFDVAITCFSFDLESKYKENIDGVLTESELNEFKSKLKNLTFSIMKRDHKGSLENAIDRLEILSNKQFIKGGNSLFDLRQRLDACKEFGTLPFAILARHAFIGQAIIKSLERIGVISENELVKFFGGIETIASQLVQDLELLNAGKLQTHLFREKYGHLRPGTYDIQSKRYDQMAIGGAYPKAEPESKRATEARVTFRFPKQVYSNIDEILVKEGISDVTSEVLVDYCKRSIVAREYGKFVFSRVLSDSLEQIASFGESNGLSREELSHVSIDDYENIANSTVGPDLEEYIRTLANSGKDKRRLATLIRLPQILSDTEGVFVVPFQISQPNFISTKIVTARVQSLNTAITGTELISGKIVLIESADPGFDWIFGQNIAGLVTMYGGVNSHMAIRCAEFNLPAAIGCGQQRFESYIRAEQLCLDCSARLITVVM